MRNCKFDLHFIAFIYLLPVYWMSPIRGFLSAKTGHFRKMDTAICTAVSVRLEISIEHQAFLLPNDHTSRRSLTPYLVHAMHNPPNCAKNQ